jgi:DNA replication protein DnaC
MAEPASIGKILNEIQSPTTGKKPQTARTSHIEQCHCEACGSAFEAEVTTYYIGGRERQVRPWECPACKEKREAEEAREREEYLKSARDEERERWRRQSGIPAYLLTRTFGNFERGCQDKALRNCRKYAEGFNLEDPKGYQSLILYSAKPGVGKTHLMIAIANHVIDRWSGDPGQVRRPVVFEKGPGLVRRIRATYSLRDKDNHHEREEDIYNQLRGARLLLLDDVGKEKPSDFTRELYWYLIDERVTSGLSLVMTCRLPLDSLAGLMGEDTVDRLYGMAGGRVETLVGESYRRQKRVA